MPRIVITVKIVPEGATEPAMSFDLDEDTALSLMGVILKVANPAPSVTPAAQHVPPSEGAPARVGYRRQHESSIRTAPKRVIDYVDRAFAKLGKPKVPIHELLSQMQADGWTTKSNSPVGVVATSMRDSGQYEYVGDGWVQSPKGQSPQPQKDAPKQVGPGLRPLVLTHLRLHGPSTLKEIETAIETAYPGEAKPVSIGLAVRNLASKNKIVKRGDSYSLPDR
jgi:hypothetical protein